MLAPSYFDEREAQLANPEIDWKVALSRLQSTVDSEVLIPLLQLRAKLFGQRYALFAVTYISCELANKRASEASRAHDVALRSFSENSARLAELERVDLQ